MIVKGYYTAQSETEISARMGVISFFEDMVMPNLSKVFKDGDFEIIRVLDNDEYTDTVKELFCFDVHFKVHLDNINIKDGTRAFSDLEHMIQSKLEIVEE